MDRKTLEWMGERVKKGEDIVAKIDHLNKVKERLPYGGGIEFRDIHGNLCCRIASHKEPGVPETSRLVRKLRGTLIELIDAEIARLEQELTEL